MYKTEIKNNEVYLEGVPYSKWTPEHWKKWKSNTVELLNQCTSLYQKLYVIEENWNFKL